MAQMTQEQLFNTVREILVEALGVDDDEVTLDAKLAADLGAESIDFMDIVFRLEKAFGIKIGQSELFPDNVLNDPRYVVDGHVTDTGMTELRSRLPHADLDEFDASRDVEVFSNVFTVDTILKFVCTKVPA